MSTVSDYINWRSDLSFQNVPINEIDAYILSKIGAPDLTGIIPSNSRGIKLRNAYNQYYSRDDINPDYFGRLNQPVLSRNLRQLTETVRFGGLMLSDYVRKVDSASTEQISALTIHIPQVSTVITFRGTDDSIVGWKENFLLAKHNAIPAQNDALEYLEYIAKKYRGPLIVMGHSKGGNLAVYSSVCAKKKIRNRISCVYNFDGPGFHDEFWTKPEALEMQGRIKNYFSQHTIVGALMNHSDNITICKSRRPGPMAHEAMLWEVLGPEFIREDSVTSASKRFGQIFNTQINQMSDEEISLFVNDLFDALTSTGAATLTDLSHLSVEQQHHILREISNTASIREFSKELMEIIFPEAARLNEIIKQLKPN